MAADCLRDGGVIAYPTDSCYALGCALGAKEAMERIQALRQIRKGHFFTVVCRDLSEISRFALVENWQYRLLRSFTPGPYAFVLRATRQVPRRLLDPRRKTIGIRVPDHAVVRALLHEYSEPLMSTTLQLPGDEVPMTDGREIEERIGHAIDMIVDAGNCGLEPSTIVDLSGDAPKLLRAGKGRSDAVSMIGSTHRPRRIIAGNSAADWPVVASGRFMDLASFLTKISIAAIPVVFAITVHEVAHGWVAKYFGDRTAEAQGRLSLNPIRHIDPIGTVLVPALMLLARRFSVRLGQARSRESAVHAQSARQYGLGVGCGTGRQSRNGDHLGVPDDARAALELGTPGAVDRSHGGCRHLHQRLARRLQHAADSAAWTAGRC